MTAWPSQVRTARPWLRRGSRPLRQPPGGARRALGSEPQFLRQRGSGRPAHRCRRTGRWSARTVRAPGHARATPRSALVVPIALLREQSGMRRCPRRPDSSRHRALVRPRDRTSEARRTPACSADAGRCGLSLLKATMRRRPAAAKCANTDVRPAPRPSPVCATTCTPSPAMRDRSSTSAAGLMIAVSTPSSDCASATVSSRRQRYSPVIAVRRQARGQPGLYRAGPRCFRHDYQDAIGLIAISRACRRRLHANSGAPARRRRT